MKHLLLAGMMLFLIACEPTEIDEGITVSDTPYLKYVLIDNEIGDSVLVPKGKAMAVNDVESVTLEYEISPYSDDVPDGFVRIEAMNILIGSEDEYAHLVQVSIMNEIGFKLVPILNDLITVTIVVELLEPIDEAEAIARNLDLSMVNVEDSELACESIIGKSISFDVSFVLIESN